MKLKFYISEYVDGRLEVETKHIHYAFRDDLNYDNFAPELLPGIMHKITWICRKENIEAVFVMV